MSLSFQAITLKPDASYPFHILAKRYNISHQETHRKPTDSLTAIVLHATGFHKETWEPTLSVLQRHLDSTKNRTISLDVWCIECPNHGQSVVLNEEALKSPEFSENFTCEKYAIAIHRFLREYPEYFCNRPLVTIGHSLGAVASIFLQQFLISEPRSLPSLSFVYCVLIEPMLSPDGDHHLAELRSRLVKAAYERRDVWPTREVARKSLLEMPSTRTWHPEVTRLYVEYGLRTHPSAGYTLAPYKGVTLCMAREQEAGMYRDPDGATKPMSSLNDLCNRTHVHLILGAVKDSIPGIVHDHLTDPSSPRKFASITNLEGAGHLVAQQSPEKLGSALFSIITREASYSKL